MKIKKIILAPFFFLMFCAFSFGQTDDSQKPKLIVFHSLTCHRCIQVKNEVIPEIEREFKGRIRIEYRDIADMENFNLLLGLKEKYKSDIQIEVPVFFFEGKFLNAGRDLQNNLSGLINESLNKPRIKEQFQKADVLKHFMSFTPLAITGAGLIDGINPCAFTVIVFFVSFLAVQGYRKSELAAIGLAFILAVFLTYLFLGLGLFNFLYSLKGFWLVTKTVNLSIGVFSIILGILAVYDFLKFKKTKETEGLILQLPAAVKNRIHKVIGLHYRKAKTGDNSADRPHIVKLLLSAFVTGFLVSLLEAVCTGQLYLPTITFVLKTTSFKLQALGYLLLYNVMFIVPLFVIFLLALLGVTSGQFAGFLKKHLLLIKIIMALVFFGFGIYLIRRG